MRFESTVRARCTQCATDLGTHFTTDEARTATRKHREAVHGAFSASDRTSDRRNGT